MFRVVAVSSLLTLASAFEIDCSTSACPDTCTCSKTACLQPIDACLGDAECSKLKSCPMECPCGDEACLLNCAGKTSSPLAVPVAQCIQTQCHTGTLLKATIEDVDCSASSCQEACQCSVDKCGDEINLCLADAECSKVQSCAMTCGCGDDECMLGCASASNSTLAAPVAECVASNCHVEAQLLRSAAPKLSCKGAACEDACKCGMGKCMGVGMACLFDSKCSAFQDCSFKCPCGDKQCAMDCANSVQSTKAMPLATCLTQKCHQDLHV